MTSDTLLLSELGYQHAFSFKASKFRHAASNTYRQLLIVFALHQEALGASKSERQRASSSVAGLKALF